MEKQEPLTINGTYVPSSRMGPMLELWGPFNREAIDDVIQKNIPSPYGFSPEYAKGKGMALFLVDDERGASELVNTLNNALRKYEFVIQYESH